MVYFEDNPSSTRVGLWWDLVTKPFYSNPVLSFKKICLCILSCKGEMTWCFEVLSCAPQKWPAICLHLEALSAITSDCCRDSSALRQGTGASSGLGPSEQRRWTLLPSPVHSSTSHCSTLPERAPNYRRRHGTVCAPAMWEEKICSECVFVCVFKPLCGFIHLKCVCFECMCSLTLMRTSAIKAVTRVKSRAVISITIAEPTFWLKNITVAIQPLWCVGESDME